MSQEDELLRRCQQGDESALIALVRLFQERLFRLAYRVLGEAGRAEEATADALLKVWDRCGQWRGEAPASTWIYRLALRLILDRARRRRRWWRPGPAEVPETPDARAGPPDTLLEEERQEELRRRLDAALRQLTEDDRALLHLYYFEQRGLADIEAILDVPRDALKMRLMRARQRLKPWLEGCDDLL